MHPRYQYPVPTISSRVPTISKTCLMYIISWVHVVGNTDHVLGGQLLYLGGHVFTTSYDMYVPKTWSMCPRYQYPVPKISIPCTHDMLNVMTISNTCLMCTLSWVHVVGNSDHVLGNNFYVLDDMCSHHHMICTHDMLNTPTTSSRVPKIC